MENEKKTFKTYFLIGVVVLQFGAIAYLISSNNKKNTEIEELTTTVDTKSAEIVAKINSLDSLSIQFERIKREREALGLNNDSLNMQINELKKFKVRALASGKINARDKRLLEEMIVKLRKDLVAKDKEIVQLKAENEGLVGQVDNLNSENAMLGDSLSGVASVKKDLENQLAYASILKAEGFVVSALKDNGKEFTADEYKSKKISQMKIAFTIADNKAAKKGNKDFFIAIIPPSGNTFSDPTNGGGELTTANGETKTYTFKQNITFTNSNEKVSFLIPKGFNYIPGSYKVQVFAEGHDIGQGKFSVK